MIRELMNKMANLVTPRLLRSPLHFLMSRRVMLVTFTGRKSGKTYATPVEYLRDGSTINFFTQRGRSWWKNLQDGAEVSVRVQGHELRGRAYAVLNEAAIVSAFQRLHPRITPAPDFGTQTVMVQITLEEAAEPYAVSRS